MADGDHHAADQAPRRVPAAMRDYPGGWLLMILVGTGLALMAAGVGWVVCLVLLAFILAVPLTMVADGARRRFHVPRGVTLTIVPVGLVAVILAALALGGLQIGNAIAAQVAGEGGSGGAVLRTAHSAEPREDRTPSPRPSPNGRGREGEGAAPSGEPLPAATAQAGLRGVPASQPAGERLADKITRVVYYDWMAGLIDRQVVSDRIADWLKTAHRLIGGLLTQFLAGLSGVVTGLGVLLVSTLIAARPAEYYRIFITLFPPSLRPRVEPVAREVGARLGRWAVARGVSAAALTVMTTVGLMLFKTPWAVGLGLITGLTSFIPVIGTLVAGAVALLTVLVARQGGLVGVLIVFVVANVVETYVLLPVLLRRAANIPPALTIGSLLVMGTVGGLPGMLIASPLALILTTVAETSRDDLAQEPPAHKGT